jgi:tetratricopeptide (TPR) repeat protein
MKKLGILISLVMFVFVAKGYAQAGRFGATPEDSVECVRYLNFYKEYYKNGNIREALPSWRGALKVCPVGVTQSLYQDGQNIIKFLINQTKDPDRRKELVDSLILMYNIRIDKFPSPKARLSAYTFKAYDMVTYYKEDETKVFSALQDVVKFGKENTDQNILLLNMQYASNLFKDNKLGAEDVINVYQQLSEIFDKKIRSGTNDALEEARNNFETVFAISGVADCDNLLALFGPRFDHNASDITYVRRVVQLLSNAGCESSDLFLKAVERLYEMEPSYNSAYYLYRLYSSRDNNENAAMFLERAINSDSIDNKTKADYLLELGTFYFKKMNKSSTAAQYALQSFEFNEETKGRAYLLIGHIWAMAKVRDGDMPDIDARANFWVSVDYFVKAKQADPSLTEECDRLIATYRQYFPTVEEAFMCDLAEGSGYTVKANGLTATTTVRTNK